MGIKVYLKFKCCWASVICILSALLWITFASRMDLKFNDRCFISSRRIYFGSVFNSYLTIFAVTATFFSLCAGNLKKKSIFQRVKILVDFLLLYCFYLGNYMAVTFLKEVISDTTCKNNRANSVSGHFNFYVFLVLGFNHLHSHLKKNENEKNGMNDFPYFGYCFIFLCATSIYILSGTLLMGHHSLRQISYGIVTGCMSHVIYFRLFFESKKKVLFLKIILWQFVWAFFLLLGFGVVYMKIDWSAVILIDIMAADLKNKFNMKMGVCSSASINAKDCWISSKRINPHKIDLSHFKIVAVIGSGGFARVFQAVNRVSGEIVAIKVMDKARVVRSKCFYKSVWTERKLMAELNHDFILPLICCFQSYYEIYLVIPFMPGSDLTHYSRSHFFLKEEEVRFYFCQILLAVEHLHLNNIVHRDVKPRNVLLQSDGNIRLCDFGLSHRFKEENEFLKNTAGTDSYNAPEMVKKTPYRFSVDIWTMGITLYELIFRKRPFRSDKQMIQFHQNKERINFSLGKGCSEMAKDLMMQMLKWNVNERIGCGKKGVSEIKNHPWLANTNWETVESCSLRPPFVPSEDEGPTTMVDTNVFGKKAKKNYEESELVDSAVQKKFHCIEHAIEIEGQPLPSLTKLPALNRREKRLLKVNLRKVFKNSMRPRYAMIE